jgi:hypothetical protein
MIYLTENGAYSEEDFRKMEAARSDAHVRAWQKHESERRMREQEEKNLAHWEQFF